MSPRLLLPLAAIALLGAGALAGALVTRDTIEIEVAAQRLEAVSDIEMDERLSIGFAEATVLDLLCGRTTLENVQEVTIRGSRLNVTTRAGRTRAVPVTNCVARLRAPPD